MRKLSPLWFAFLVVGLPLCAARAQQSSQGGGGTPTAADPSPVRVVTGTADGAGQLLTLGANESLNLALTTFTGAPNAGVIGGYDPGGNLRMILGVAPEGSGFVEVAGSNGNSNVVISHPAGNANDGAIAVSNNGGNTRAQISISSDVGYVETFGPNGSSNVRISSLAANLNHGFVAVKDSAGATQAGIYVDSAGNGIVFGDTKAFCMPHPNRDGAEIWYAAVEGPEAAAYLRGTGTLRQGRATIEFPEHFKVVANPAGMTVTLTPLSADSKGLAVVEKGQSGITVVELGGGRGNYEFDYMAIAVRHGHESFRVIRERGEGAERLRSPGDDAVFNKESLGAQGNGASPRP